MILSYTRMTSSLITMHIVLSLVALGFRTILCYVLFIILGIYLSTCILHRRLYNTQEMPLPLSKAQIITQGYILLSEIILRALRGVL